MALASIGALFLVLAWIRVSANLPQPIARETPAAAEREEPVQLAWPREGQAAVAIEGLGTFVGPGESAPVAIASVAKVMTAYLVLRDHPIEPGEEGFTMQITPADVEDFRQRLLGQRDGDLVAAALASAQALASSAVDAARERDQPIQAAAATP